MTITTRDSLKRLGRPSLVCKRLLIEVAWEDGLGTRLSAMTAQEVETILRRAGVALVRETDHRIYREGDRTIPVPSHRGDLKMGTPSGIIKLSGMTTDEFLSDRS